MKGMFRTLPCRTDNFSPCVFVPSANVSLRCPKKIVEALRYLGDIDIDDFIRRTKILYETFVSLKIAVNYRINVRLYTCGIYFISIHLSLIHSWKGDYSYLTARISTSLFPAKRCPRRPFYRSIHGFCWIKLQTLLLIFDKVVSLYYNGANERSAY